jgi:hypothetical protein
MKITSTVLRYPTEMHKKIKDQAKDYHRSINSQLNIVIELGYKMEQEHINSMDFLDAVIKLKKK